MEISQFAAKLFECRDILHILHLKTRSYSQHKSLGKLYEFMVEWSDTFLETYKGFNGDFDFDMIHVEDAEKYDPKSYVILFIDEVLIPAKDELAEDMPTHGFLVNMIEENIAECYHTIYKLEFLR